MRKLIWTLVGLSLSVAIVLGTRVPIVAVPPEGPGAPLLGVVPVQRDPLAVPMPAPPKPSAYEVKSKDGAFFICAAYYSGEHSGYLADQVVHQLRAKNINSFVYNYADRERRELEWAYHQHMKLKPNIPYRPRFTKVEQQVAVLIGGFKSMADASKSLAAVRKLPAPDVKFPSGELACDRVMVYGDGHRRGKESDAEETRPLSGAVVNPFEACFVIRNPVSAKSQTQDENYVDPAWKQMNVNESYNLLKCKKNFTLVVKVYRGPSSVQSGLNGPSRDGSFQSALDRGPEIMEAMASQAHQLAGLLHDQHYEAYVLHTRFGSIVTVGGFAAQGDEEMVRMHHELSKLRMIKKNSPTLAGQNINPDDDPWSLLPDPMPMRVPRL